MEDFLTNDLMHVLEEAKAISYTQPKISFEMSRKTYSLAKKKKLINEEAYSLIMMAFACRSMSNLNDCIKYSYQALKVYESIQDNIGQAKALNLIGIVYFYYAMHDQAIENFEKALNLTQDMIDNSYLQSCILNNIGEVQREENNTEKALDTFNKSLNITEELGYKTNTAAIYNNIGKVYSRTKKYSKALTYLKKSYSILLNEENPILLAETENSIAEIYMIRQDISKAEEYLKNSLNRLQIVENKFYIIDVLTSLGQIEIIKGSNNFMDYLDKAISYSVEMKTKSKLLKIYNILYEFYESKCDYSNALEFFKKGHYIQLELETTNQRQRLEIINFELKYLKANSQINKVSKLNQRLNEEIKTQRVKLEDMRKLNKDLNKKALHDELTEAPNRRYINEYLKKAWKKANKNCLSISFFLMDIDYFKRYNDYWGHNKGDECLKLISNCLRKLQATNQGFFGRYGGEEFIYYVENIDYDDAASLGNLLRNEVESQNMKYNYKEESKTVTMSIGAVHGVISPKTSIQEVIQIADKELYKAKESGRNKFFITEL